MQDNDSSAVSVTILKRHYSFKTPESGKVALQQMASELDKKLCELAAQLPQFSRDELLTLTALNVLYSQQQLLQQEKLTSQKLQALTQLLKSQTELE